MAGQRSVGVAACTRKVVRSPTRSRTLTLLTSRDMGYSRAEGDGKMRSFGPEDAVREASPGGPVDWVFQVPIDVAM